MGERIKQLRAGRPQTTMACLAGITQGMWSKCEDGNLPDIDILYRISKALGTSVEFLWDNIELFNIVSEPKMPYQRDVKTTDVDLARINNEWPELCDHQKIAIISVLDAFSKQDTNSLELKDNKA